MAVSRDHHGLKGVQAKTLIWMAYRIGKIVMTPIHPSPSVMALAHHVQHNHVLRFWMMDIAKELEHTGSRHLEMVHFKCIAIWMVMMEDGHSLPAYPVVTKIIGVEPMPIISPQQTTQSPLNQHKQVGECLTIK